MPADKIMKNNILWNLKRPETFFHICIHKDSVEKSSNSQSYRAKSQRALDTLIVREKGYSPYSFQNSPIS